MSGSLRTSDVPTNADRTRGTRVRVTQGTPSRSRVTPLDRCYRRRMAGIPRPHRLGWLVTARVPASGPGARSPRRTVRRFDTRNPSYTESPPQRTVARNRCLLRTARLVCHDCTGCTSATSPVAPGILFGSAKLCKGKRVFSTVDAPPEGTRRLRRRSRARNAWRGTGLKGRRKDFARSIGSSLPRL